MYIYNMIKVKRNVHFTHDTLVHVKQDAYSQIHITKHSDKERESTSRLANFSHVNHSVKEPSSSENLRHESHTARVTCTRSSVKEDQGDKGDNVLHVIEMSPENDGHFINFVVTRKYRPELRKKYNYSTVQMKAVTSVVT